MTYETPIGANMFAYCGNNPVANADNGGEWAHIAVGAAIGAAMNVAMGYLTAVQNGEKYSIAEGVIDAATGAISGGLAASSIGRTTQVIVGGVMSAASTIAKGISKNQKVSIVDIGFSAATGALSGFLGGDGATKDIKVANAIDVMKNSGSTILKPNKTFAKAFNSVASDFALAKSKYMAGFTISNLLNVYHSG